MDPRVVEAAREAMARRRLPGLLVAVDHRGGTELWHEGYAAGPLGNGSGTAAPCARNSRTFLV